MPFTPEQFQAIYQALSAKVIQACPSCGQAHKREIQQELFLIPGQTRPPLDPSRTYSVPSQQIAVGTSTIFTASYVVPCVMSTCTNCGMTELYNVHTLGIAAIVGVPPAGTPLVYYGDTTTNTAATIWFTNSSC